MYVEPLSKYCLTLYNIINYPANICWSWRRLQHVFSVTIFRLPRRLEGRKILTLRTSSKRLQDMSQRHLEDMSWRSLEDMSWRRLEDMSWRRLEDMSWRYVLKTSWRQTKCLPGIFASDHGLLTNLNQYLTNLYLIKLYFTNLRRIQNASIRIQ